MRNESYLTSIFKNLSRLTGLICFMLLIHFQGNAQSISNYAFTTNTTGSLEDLSSGSTSLLTGVFDDASSAVAPIGFSFIFMGVPYTHFSVNSNGQMQLHTSSGATAIGTNVTTSAGLAILAPFTGDNEVGNGIRYKLNGTAPNRTLIVEWNQFYVNFVNINNAGNMQVWINETTGVVNYVYGEIYNSSSSSLTRSISIASSNTPTTVGSITISSSPAFTASSTLTSNTIAAGSGTTTGSPLIANIGSSAQGSRRIFTFTPPADVPAAPTWATPTAITLTGMTLNWADNATDEIGYVIMRSTDNVNFIQQGTTLAANTTTLAVTGLSPGTLYYWKIIAVREGTGAEATDFASTLAGSTYYWVGTSGSTWNTAANWNTAADGTGSPRTTVATTDVLIVDGAGTTAGAATTISVDLASFSIGQFKVTNNTACTLQSSATTTRTITITGGGGTDYLIESGSTLNLTSANNAVAFVFSGTGNVGDISGTLNFAGSTSNLLTTTGGTGTLVTVTGTGVVNLGATGNSLVGSVATLSFLDNANCNSTGATTGAPPVPLATWATNSNLTITGITTSSSGPTNNAQSFGNLTYNCPTASGTMSFWTTSTSAVIKGNLTITAGASGGTGIFRAVTSGTVTVNGNVTLNQGRLQSASISGTFIVLGNTTNNADGIIDILSGTYSQRGTTFTNNGVLTGVSSTSTLQFLSFTNVAQTFAGSGTVLTNVGVITLQNGGGLTITHVNQIPVLRVNLIVGAITGSGKITMGTGATLAVITQIGATGLTSPGGSFDVSPTYNLGTGTHSILYSQESVSRTTGFEIPATRTVTNVTVNNTNGVTLSGGDLTIGTTAAAGLLTLTAGILDAGSSSIILPFTGTSISGGSATSYVNGKLLRSFAASRPASGTYTTATLFPIGKGGNYMPVHIDPTTTSVGSITFSAEAFTSNSGTGIGGVTNLSANRWEALPTSGSGNLTNVFIRISDGTMVNTKKIVQGDAPVGNYSGIIPVTTGVAGPPVTLTTATSLLAANYTGYIAYGDLTPCTAPSNPPTILTFSNLGSTSLTGTFTAANPSPNPASHYLVVRYASGAAPTIPVDFTAYTVGATLGLGNVRAVLTNPTITFNDTGLSLGTTYDYYVYSYQNSACNGPVYLSSHLLGSVTTCAATTGTPGTPTASAFTNSSFTASWTASSTPLVNYILDVASDASFTSFVPGFAAKNVGTALTDNITGLSVNTNYFVRVRADLAGCVSAPSSSLNTFTECDAITSFPASEPFATYLPSTCWKEGDLGDLTAGPSVISQSASSWGPDGFLNSGTTGAAKLNIFSTADSDWLISPYYTIPAAGYRVKYSVGATQYDVTTALSTPWESDDFVQLLVSTSNSNWTVLRTYNNTNIPSHLGQIDFSDLSAYNGQTVRFAFRGVEGATDGSADIDFFIDNFVVEETPIPTITMLGTLSGCPGNTLEIIGTNLEGATAANVQIGGTPVASITNNTGTVLTVVVGSGNSGTVSVIIGANTATSTDTYTVNTKPTSSAATNTPVCEGTTLELYGTTNAGAGATFAWTGPNSFTSMSEDPTISGATTAAAGTYTFTATTAAGCTSDPATTVVVVNPSPTATVITQGSSVGKCAGAPAVELNATGGEIAISSTVGSGTSFNGATSNPTAFCNRFDEYIGQQIYTATELTSQGLVAGDITSIAFNVSTLGDAADNANYQVSIGHIGSTSTFPSTSFLSTTGYTNVYGPITHTHTASGWQVITFSTPFNWNGIDNICIHMTHDGIDATSNARTEFTTTTGNTTLTFTSSTPGATSTTGTLSTLRLNVRFTQNTILPKIWSPSTGLFTDPGGAMGYNGMDNAPTIYAAPPATQSYTVTATTALGCTSAATINVGIDGSTVTSTANAGPGTLRAALNCVLEGGTIMYDQPTTATTVLTAPLTIDKNVTIMGASAASRPEITIDPASGISINAMKTLTLKDVDIKSTAPTQTFSGAGNVSVTGLTITKQ